MKLRDRFILRERIRRRDGVEADTCPWCERRFCDIQPKSFTKGGHPLVVTFEHIVAKRDGGTLKISNVVLVCLGCNRKREELARRGVQDEARLIGSLLSHQEATVRERERRRAILSMSMKELASR